MWRMLIIAAIGLLPAAAGGQAVEAKKLYETRCSLCHGVDGDGNGPAGGGLQPAPTKFTSADYWKAANTEQIKTIIKSGKPGTAMVPFGAMLKPEEIDAVTEYLRTFAPK